MIVEIKSSNLSKNAHLDCHTIIPQFISADVTEAVCMWVNIRIPVNVVGMRLATPNPDNKNEFILNVYKQFDFKENNGLLIYSKNGEENKLILDDLTLDEGTYIFEVLSSNMSISEPNFLNQTELPNNKFFAIYDGIPLSFTQLTNEQHPPRTFQYGGISEIFFQYRKTDTYLGMVESDLNPQWLVPGAWFHLINEDTFTTKLWTGTKFVIQSGQGSDDTKPPPISGWFPIKF
jgi:hypothetical protein